MTEWLSTKSPPDWLIEWLHPSHHRRLTWWYDCSSQCFVASHSGSRVKLTTFAGDVQCRQLFALSYNISILQTCLHIFAFDRNTFRWSDTTNEILQRFFTCRYSTMYMWVRLMYRMNVFHIVWLMDSMTEELRWFNRECHEGCLIDEYVWDQNTRSNEFIDYLTQIYSSMIVWLIVCSMLENWHEFDMFELFDQSYTIKRYALWWYTYITYINCILINDYHINRKEWVNDWMSWWFDRYLESPVIVQ